MHIIRLALTLCSVLLNNPDATAQFQLVHFTMTLMDPAKRLDYDRNDYAWIHSKKSQGGSHSATNHGGNGREWSGSAGQTHAQIPAMHYP
ncbi:hypothetical protein VTI74DRAFT_5404 [Chaetomium olivicolor]